MDETENLERALVLCWKRLERLAAKIEDLETKATIANAKFRMEENNYQNLERRIYESKNPSFVRIGVGRAKER